MILLLLRGLTGIFGKGFARWLERGQSTGNAVSITTVGPFRMGSPWKYDDNQGPVCPKGREFCHDLTFHLGLGKPQRPARYPSVDGSPRLLQLQGSETLGTPRPGMLSPVSSSGVG